MALELVEVRRERRDAERSGTTPAMLGYTGKDIATSLTMGIGSLVWGALFAMIMQQLPADDFSNGASVTQTLQRIGNALGVAVMVTVLDTTLVRGRIASFPEAFAVLAVLGAVATGVGFLAARPAPAGAADAPG